MAAFGGKAYQIQMVRYLALMGLFLLAACSSPIQSSVVKISLEGGHGSGVVIDAKQGLILTAGHVADVGRQAGEGTMQLETADGCKEMVHVLWVAEKDDVALMQATGNCPLHAATIRTTPMHAGEHVWAVGYPLWMGQITTEGQVLNADIKLPGEDRHTMITDALIVPGNSGGGLFDSAGYLVGINVALATFGGGFSVYPSGHYLVVPMPQICLLLQCP